MTTYTYTEGTYPSPTSRQGPGLNSNTAIMRSVLTGAIQTASRPGSRWHMRLSWQSLTPAQFAQVFGFFSRLNGAEHRARIPIFGYVRQGGGGGTVTVNGAGQTGSSLLVAGLTGGAGAMKAGDLFSVYNGTFREIKVVTADVDSASPTINLMPEIHVSPTNGGALDVSDPVYGDFILVSPVDQQVSSRVQGNSQYLHSLELDFVEQMTA